MEMRADGTAMMGLSQMSVASWSRRLSLTNNRREIRLIAPKTKTASNMNDIPSHTTKQILAANNKIYPLRRLQIDFICTTPPPVQIVWKKSLKSILRKYEFAEKGSSYFSMRGQLNPLFMQFYISFNSLILQQGDDEFCPTTYIIFRKKFLACVFTVLSLINKSPAISRLDLSERISCNTSYSQSISRSIVLI
jgi:hypothetical protein